MIFLAQLGKGTSPNDPKTGLNKGLVYTGEPAGWTSTSENGGLDESVGS